MSIWKLVKLNFGRSPAHFGEVGIGIEETSERVRSDTLFSAWMSAYARLYGSERVEQLLQRFLDQPQQPPIRMSSTFIYRQGMEMVYYLPRPLKFPINYPEDDLDFFKTYKSLKYLPLEIWQRWYQGEGFTEGDRAELIARTQKQPKKGGCLDETGTFDYGSAFKTNQVPKIAVDRTTRATNLYHTGFVQFEWEQNCARIKNSSGLYFLLQFSEADQELEHNIHAALNLLGEEGLGGERSSGAGRFEVEWLELPETWQKVVGFSEGTRHSLISLFWELPLSSELLEEDGSLKKDASYEIQERGGWIASPFSGRQLRRKMVRMFTEGSVFPSPPQGKLADVTPERFDKHKIYRNGISLSLPIKV